MAAHTSTGSFGIGFRRGWSDWEKSLPGTIAFAKANNFASIDVGPLPRAELQSIVAAGLAIGSIDLNMSGMVSPDAGKRKAAAEGNARYAASVSDLCKNFFTAICPEDHARPRADNFRDAVDSYRQLCTELVKHGSRIVIEGWPGGDPHVSTIACTPADYRAFLAELPAEGAAINFDPSHLVRMGIDPVRFLGEFAPRVRHVHGKDTEIMPEALYEHGWSQPPTFAKGHGFGGIYWRYTIPGHGQVRWTTCFSLLAQAGYKGLVSIELEDGRYNGSQAGEQRGLLAGRDYLQSV